MITPPENNFQGSEPKKKAKPTGILKELMELKKYPEDTYLSDGVCYRDYIVKWSDVEKIINKYENP